MIATILICSYNSARTLGAALDSALGQNFPADDYEVLLVDDGSTDNTQEVADTYSNRHDNFRYVKLPTNKGLVAACNYGIKAALGRYFIRLDADDTFHPDILRNMVEPLERGETDFVYCDRYEVDLETGRKNLVEVEPFNLFELIAIGVMMHTDMLREICGYRPMFWEEYDIFMRYLEKTEKSPVRVPQPLISYSRHSSSMTANPENVRKGWQELRNIWGDDVLKSYGWSGMEQEVLS
jgi:glycosyltransferase involved in cell wall biosynthesis